MPFTLAHPAAAVPLCRPLRRYGVLSALVIGSMTPDLWYALPLPIGRNDSHSVAGLFWFCLPAGLALYVLFHRVLKHPMVSLLPRLIASRLWPWLARHPGMPDARWRAVVASVFVGATTHTVWDSFTHWQGTPARTFMPWLRTQLFTAGPFEIYPVHLLQHGTGALGLLLLAHWCWRWLKTAPAIEREPQLPFGPTSRAIAFAGLVSFAVVYGIAVAFREAMPGVSVVQAYVRPAAFSSLQALLWGVTAYSAVWHIGASRRRNASP
jgi:uncharacterized membrane protein YidH (DUF202 family)